VEASNVSKHAGSCLCGQVRFEIEGDFDRFFFCHCQRCRKGTGSAHGANLFSTSATLTWLAGQDRITQYNVPDSRHARTFCSACGGAVPRQRSGMLVVPAGSLDTELYTQPTAHIFTASRANWDKNLESVRAFDELPV
jgi:hypothetical protein